MRPSDSYQRSDDDCPHCDGTLWKDDATVMCGDCNALIGGGYSRDRTRSSAGKTTWERFQENRPTYKNSGNPVCVGGLADYDWMSSDDVDGPVSAVNPDNFYR